MLTGDYPRLHKMRAMWGVLPSAPRCKLCNAPFRGPGGALMRAIGYGPSPLNRRLCKWCLRAVGKHPGGAEIEISVLFADVRGSTAIAERMEPGEFSRLLARFYGAAARVIDERDGIVDKFVGDGAVALFIPGFAGNDHAVQAIAAARGLVEQTGNYRVAFTPDCALASARSSSRGQLGSCIESEHDLVRFLVAPMSESAPLAHDKETALRQHTNRRGVVARSASVKRTGCLQLQELL